MENDTSSANTESSVLLNHVQILNEQFKLIKSEIELINKKLVKLNLKNNDKKHNTEPVILVLYDLETTGLGMTSEIQITEIGAIEIDLHGKKKNEFRELVRTSIPVSKSVSHMTTNTTQSLQQLSNWKIVSEKFNNWLLSLRKKTNKKIFLCAHNGKRFDSRLLVFENKRHGVEFLRDLYHLDTLPLFKSMFPGLISYSLSKIYFHLFAKAIKNCHTAIGDINAMIEIIEIGLMHGPELLYKWINKDYESFDAVQKRCLKK
jgi:DNA polymerase III alpha subunit (gram-positive type)